MLETDKKGWGGSWVCSKVWWYPQGMEGRRVETLQQSASRLGDENIETIVEDRKRSGEHHTPQIPAQCVH